MIDGGGAHFPCELGGSQRVNRIGIAGAHVMGKAQRMPYFMCGNKAYQSPHYLVFKLTPLASGLIAAV